MAALNNFPYGYFFALVFVFSLTFTEIVRFIAQKLGFVSRPGGTEQRWNQRTVSLGGGIAINLAIFAGILWIWNAEILLGILPALVFVFVMGLVDDVRGVPPSLKLLVQTIAAIYVVSQGYVFPVGWPVVGIALTVIWIVGVSNAVNLIDNMDGLASGVAVIAAAGLAALLWQVGDLPHAALALCLAGASAGFLMHNFYPARIFMGDAGSLALGFLLAVLSTRLRFPGEISQTFTLIPAALLLVVPLFDTTLVTIARRNANRPISLGGRDHTSHRLVWLGLTERRTVTLLYLLGAMGALLSSLLMHSSANGVFAIFSIAMILLTLFGVFLLELAVYPALSVENCETRKSPAPGLVQGHNSLPMPVLVVMELAIDICMICLAWTSAHLLRFQDQQLQLYRELAVVPMLPQLIGAKLVAFFFFRLYRGMWRTIVAQDVYRIFKAATLGTLLFIAISALSTRLQDLSRIVIVLDWMLTFLGLVGARAAISAFHRWTRYLSGTPHRAALLGSSALVEFVQDESLDNEHISFFGVIATEEDAVLGNGILGRATDLEKILKEKEIDILYVTSERSSATLSHLASTGVMIRQVRLQML